MVLERTEIRNGTYRVGIFDTDESQTRRMRFLLNDKRYFRVFSNPVQGNPLDFIEETRPDILILGGNNFSLLQEIREGYSLPIIAINKDNDGDDMVRMLDGGADDCLVRGKFGGRQLVARIRALIRRYGMEQDRINSVLTNQ